VAEARTIRVGALARVEGEGALHLVMEGDRVAELRLEIFEPPRFFEAFLRGRAARELPDLMARICGICPVAYQMSAVHAVESIFGIAVHPQVRALRRLYYAGEWIESHLLHMVFLQAPDYLGCDDATQIAKIAREPVELSLRVRAMGNRILSLLGARPINPVGVCLGGFHRAPSRHDMEALADALAPVLTEARALFDWLASLSVPSRPQPLELVCLSHPDEYPMNEGSIVSSRGLSTSAAAFEAHFEERQVPHSTALHCLVRGRGPYQVGPLARVLMHRDKLHPRATDALASVAHRFTSPDPAAAVFARAVEVIHALEEAGAIAAAYTPPPPAAPVEPRAGVGHGATEAPRGLLYVRVETDARGDVAAIRIVPPTSQNQAAIEADLRALAPLALARPDPKATRMLEAAIRDYDPCISCSTHFLRLHVEHRAPESIAP
jgi:coenzyme F420-reducing hydrogenase alpha subunit